MNRPERPRIPGWYATLISRQELCGVCPGADSTLSTKEKQMMADDEITDQQFRESVAWQQTQEAQEAQARQHAADTVELAAWRDLEDQRAKPELMKKRYDRTITPDEARKLSEIIASDAARRTPTWRDETVPWRHDKEPEQG